MSFAEALAGAARKPGSKCGVGKALATFTGEDLATLVAALDDCGPGKAINCTQLSRALKAEGVAVTHKGVSNHINGECSCGPR
jgi:hypothetical protein